MTFTSRFAPSGFPQRKLKRQLKNLALTVPGLRAVLLVIRIHLDNALVFLTRRLFALRGTPLQAQRVAVSAIRAPIYTATDGAFSFQRTANVGKPRAMVLSIPKSGTHLMYALLTELGLAPTHVFVCESAFDDQRFLEGKDLVLDMKRKIPCPLAISAQLVRPGQFALSHMICDESVKQQLEDFRLFFICRELRAMFVSNMRWRMKPGHGDEFGTAWKNEPDDKRRMEQFMRLYATSVTNTNREIAKWQQDPAALAVKFETLCGDEGEDARRALVKKIAARLDVQLSDEQATDILQRAIGANTKTWSGERSILERYWTDECERIFHECGSAYLNGLLGYA